MQLAGSRYGSPAALLNCGSGTGPAPAVQFRAGLAGVPDRVRRSPDTAVFVGAHRKAEVVLVSVEQYEALQEAAER